MGLRDSAVHQGHLPLPLPAGADAARVKQEIEEVIGLDCSNAISASAKQVC